MNSLGCPGVEGNSSLTSENMFSFLSGDILFTRAESTLTLRGLDLGIACFNLATKPPLTAPST